MRKNVRNDKVVRAITIGLATMIAATSMPVTAFANEEAPAAEAPAEAPAPAAAETPTPAAEESAAAPAETQSEAPAETPSEAPAETPSEAPAETPSEAPSEAPAEAQSEQQAAEQQAVEAAQGIVDQLLGQAPTDGTGTEAPGVISDAIAAAEPVNSIATAPVTVPSDSSAEEKKENTLKENLEETKKNVEEVKESLEKLKSEIVSIESTTSESSVLPSTPKVDEDGQEVRDEEGLRKLELDKDNLSKEDGTVNLNTTEDTMIKSFYGDYQNALDVIKDKKVDDITDEDLKEVNDFADKAEEKIEAAQATVDILKKAVANTNEAQAALDRAQERLAAVKAIRDQYNKVLEEYYKKAFGNNFDDSLKNEDGSINFYACAEKMDQLKNANNEIEKLAKGPGDPVFEYGRYLLKMIVEEKTKNSEDVDWENAQFEFEKGTNKDKKAVGADGTTEYYKQTKSDVGSDGGRHNRFKVTYYKNGAEEPTVEYYNYVFKNPKLAEDAGSGDGAYLKDGVIYVAQIKYNETTKKWDTLENVGGVYDDYSVIDAAVKDVDAAQAKVNELKKAVENIVKVATGKDTIGKLEDELEAAQSDLNNSKENLDVLRQLYASLKQAKEDAKKDPVTPGTPTPTPVTPGTPAPAPVTPGTPAPAPATPAPGTTATTDDTPSSDPFTVIDAGGYTYTIPAALSGVDFSIFGGTAATVTAPAAGGVAGVREDAAGEIGGGAIEEAGEENEEGSEETVNPVEGNKIKNIDEGKVPLAAAPPIEEGLMINWWWFLVILLLGETGKKMYDDHMMKVKAREEADRAN